MLDPPAVRISECVETLLDAFHARTPIRTGSLVVTIFGDAVVPRGGVMSLACLLRITRAFRLGDGLVRTALSRLVTEGWFERSKAGRNSFYRLTRTGHETFTEATGKIYGMADHPWRSRFDAVVFDGDDRDAFRAVWGAAGYGPLSADVMIAPSRAPPAPEPGLAALRFELMPHDQATAIRLARRCWPLAAVEARYSHFIALYTPLDAWPRTAAAIDDLEALVVRLSLIHDYRRIVLADPQLPSALLPGEWEGTRARALCARIYRAVVGGGERWLDRFGESDTGPLPQPDGAFSRRFEDGDDK